MYKSDKLHFGTVTDTQTDKYDDVTGLYLDHSCSDWVIGGRLEVEQMIKDLQKMLEDMPK